MRLPKYSERRGWVGGDKNVLYAFEDKRTGHVLVRPREHLGGSGPGPDVFVRVATRAEAERLWQSPLHSGWKTKNPGRRSRARRRRNGSGGASMLLGAGVLAGLFYLVARSPASSAPRLAGIG